MVYNPCKESQYAGQILHRLQGLHGDLEVLSGNFLGYAHRYLEQSLDNCQPIELLDLLDYVIDAVKQQQSTVDEES